MSTGRILFAGDPAIAERIESHLGSLPGNPKLLSVEDGHRAVLFFTRLIKNRHPPIMLVISGELKKISSKSVGRIIRTIEESMGSHPVPILFQLSVPSEEIKPFLGTLGRSVHLHMPKGQELDEVSRRLVKATARVFKQIRSRA